MQLTTEQLTDIQKHIESKLFSAKTQLEKTPRRAFISVEPGLRHGLRQEVEAYQDLLAMVQLASTGRATLAFRGSVSLGNKYDIEHCTGLLRLYKKQYEQGVCCLVKESQHSVELLLAHFTAMLEK